MKCKRQRCPNVAGTRGLCNKHYAQFRAERERYGIAAYVAPDRAAAHLQRLIDAGLNRGQVARLSGVNDMSLHNLQTRRYDTIRVETEQKLLAVPLPGAPFAVASGRSRVDSTGTVRRLRALIAMGYTQKFLAYRLDTHEPNLAQIVIGNHPLVLARTGRQVHELYRELSQQLPDPLSTRSVRRARANGWLAPIWWDDDTIDDPAANPAKRGSRLSFVDRYAELVDIGTPAMDIPRRLGITARSVQRCLNRHDMHVPDGINELASEELRAEKAARAAGRQSNQQEEYLAS